VLESVVANRPHTHPRSNMDRATAAGPAGGP
jgi:hypothetical protein